MHCEFHSHFSLILHVVPQETTCRGVILGVENCITNKEITRFARAPPGYKVLKARTGKSKAVVITFKGTEVTRSIEFDWNQIPSFIYKTKAACLNCREVGHMTGSCPEPRGYACTMYGTPNTGGMHECTPKCALCGRPTASTMGRAKKNSTTPPDGGEAKKGKKH